MKDNWPVTVEVAKSNVVSKAGAKLFSVQRESDKKVVSFHFRL